LQLLKKGFAQRNGSRAPDNRDVEIDRATIVSGDASTPLARNSGQEEPGRRLAAKSDP
jgi:hypothetical protein